MNKFFVLSFVLLLAACATSPPHEPTRIDSTTAETFHTSWKKLTAELTPGEQSALSLAVLRIGLSDVKTAADARAQGDVTLDSIRGKVNGLTYSEILELARRSPTAIVQTTH